ncbi:DUF2264 domain-containing protein [Salmonella enterica]|uniref:DUF2264 domain-containing protein n=1 Tax=Salmonella enterica TaxID=28901 RepID=A0A5U2F8B5_SALER|nr:DUF2264 domain-containing protein [Salmonella enterica]
MISPTQRPWLPHEHPGWKDYTLLFLQKLKRDVLLRKPFISHNSEMAELFAKNHLSFKEKCEQMAVYFIDSFFYYSRFQFCRAYLPGWPSEQGSESDAIEATARTLPLMAAWLHYQMTNQGKLDSYGKCVRQALKQAFICGTDPEHPGYWGKIKDYDQRICECCDIALALWLVRNTVWKSYSASEQERILCWLQGVNNCKTVDNNWHLFIVLTQQVVLALSGKGENSEQRYARVKEFYVGEGWFRDGANGNFDYYNSWAFHYLLFWIDRINPDFDHPFITQSCAEFAKTFRYFFTPCGFPFFGRSISYRLAAPVALMANAIQSGRADGQLKRIISTLTHFFMLHGAEQHGAITQGLFQADRRLMDGYSGSGSSLWSLRTLILMLYAGTECELWDIDEAPLEVETASFDFTIDAISARVTGIKETQEVIVTFTHDQYPDAPFRDGKLITQGWWPIVLESISGRSTRPKNNLLRKGVTTFSSRLNLYL